MHFIWEKSIPKPIKVKQIGILENSVWLKIGVFGIIEPNTPLLLYKWLKVTQNGAKNVGTIPLRKMDSCDENKGINVRNADMFFRTKLVSTRRRVKYRTKNFGKTTPSTSKLTKNSVIPICSVFEQYRKDSMNMFCPE